MTVGIVVATYGDYEYWGVLAQRALVSARRQTVPVRVMWVHGESLHQARNQGIRDIESEYVVVLDADDELDSGYVEAMLAAEGDIRRPATLGIYSDGSQDSAAVLIPRRDLSKANYIVIGAMVSREWVLRLGGFRDFPALEDWDLWRRMVADGASVADVPDAIYRVHVSDKSRNSVSVAHAEAYRRIVSGE